MTAHTAFVDTLLAVVVLTCWVGMAGMLRMRQPTAALNYLTLPATAGVAALTLAVFLETGWSSQSFKTLLIALVLLAINSVVTHATARAFRTRELGHWEPRDGDPFEYIAPQSGHTEHD